MLLGVRNLLSTAGEQGKVVAQIAAGLLARGLSTLNRPPTIVQRISSIYHSIKSSLYNTAAPIVSAHTKVENADPFGMINFENMRVYQGSIRKVMKTVKGYMKHFNVLMVFLGERLHLLLLKTNLINPYMVKPLKELNFNQFLIESLLADTNKELLDIKENILPTLEGSIDEKTEKLRETILNDKDRFSKLHFNVIESNLRDKRGLVELIVRAHELGISLRGVIDYADVPKENRADIITNKGLSEALRLKKLMDKGSGGRIVIVGGDVHGACRVLDPTEAFADTESLNYGYDLFKLLRYQYLHIRQKSNFTEHGLAFYLGQYEGLKKGHAKAIFIRDEEVHRILLIYNVTVNNSKFAQGGPSEALNEFGSQEKSPPGDDNDRPPRDGPSGTNA